MPTIDIDYLIMKLLILILLLYMISQQYVNYVLYQVNHHFVLSFSFLFSRDDLGFALSSLFVNAPINSISSVVH